MKLSTLLGAVLMGVWLVAAPATAKRQPAAADCENWNTEEFFRTATVETAAACLAAGADVAARTDEGDTPLHMAANFSSNPGVIKALLAAGADIETRAGTDIESRLPDTPLLRAAGRSHHAAVVEALLEAGADIEARTNGEYALTALHLAALYNSDHPAMIEPLVAAGADPNALVIERGATDTSTGLTPLHFAARRNNAAMIEAFISSGAAIDAKDDSRRTPLHVAAQYNGNPDVIEALIGAGADPNVTTYRDLTPLHLAAQHNEHPAIVTSLVRNGADVEALGRTADWSEVPPLALANNAAVVEALVEAGADATRTFDGTETLLHVAAKANNSKDGLAALIALGGDPMAQASNVGYTPLHFAHSQAAVEVLVAAGADPNARLADPIGETPLHDARTAEVAKALIAAGADPMARDYNGATPLHRAQTPEIAKALIAAGADPMARTPSGFTPLHFADSGDVVEALLSAGANVMARDESGSTPLHSASSDDVVEALFAAGANVMARNELGRTPLHRANSGDVIEALLSAGADLMARDERGDTPLHVAASWFSKYPLATTQRAVGLFLDAGAQVAARNVDGKTPWDILQDSEDLDELKKADEYWRMNEARFKEPAQNPGPAPAAGTSRTQEAPGGRGAASAGTATPSRDTESPRYNPGASSAARECLIPGFPSPDDPENLGLPWCPANVDFQIRSFALTAAGAQCAIATGSSSTPEQIEARNRETADLCARLDAVTDRFGGAECRCPGDWRSP